MRLRRHTLAASAICAAIIGLLLQFGTTESAPPGCDTRYGNDVFHACFFELNTGPSGTQRTFGAYLGGEDEPLIPPGTNRTFAVSRQWNLYYDWSVDIIFNRACSDGVDNDGDGLTDSLDLNCVPPLEGPAGSTNCFDRTDNDADGLTDGSLSPSDPGCFAPPPDESPPPCSDGLDNDTDGMSDASDVDCQRPLEGHAYHPTCYDTLDNDGDNLFDYDGNGNWDLADPGCNAPPPHEGRIGTGISNNVAGTWRGKIFFNGGRYQFTVIGDDGVRLYIDETLVLDEWVDTGWSNADYTVARQISRGHHNIRLEWYQTYNNAQVRLHWDKVPDVPNQQTSVAVIDAFILKRQDICIAGNPVPTGYTGGTAEVYNPDGSLFKAWLPDAALRTLRPSDQTLSSYAQVECFSFGFRDDEIGAVYSELAEFERLIEQWTFNGLDLRLEVTELQEPVPLTLYGLGWWVQAHDMESATRPYVTADTDFTMGLPSIHDIGNPVTASNGQTYVNTGRWYGFPACGLEQGADSALWGAGYHWVAHTTNPGTWYDCQGANVIANEWSHQMAFVVNSILDIREPFNPAGLSCGASVPDSFRWFPDHYGSPDDPVSPWCGWRPKNQAWPIKNPAPPGIAPQLAENLMWHFDSSLSHYRLSSFTGNHCNDGKQNVWDRFPRHSEVAIDTGGNCPFDSDLDGFLDGDETRIGSDPWKSCPATGSPDNEALDAFPADFNDDQHVNIIDVGRMDNAIQAYNSGTFNSRFDLNADGQIDGADRSLVATTHFEKDPDSDGVETFCDVCPLDPNCDDDALSDHEDMENDTDSLGLTRVEFEGRCPTFAGGPGPVFRDCIELHVGTNPLDACANTSTANDEATDKSPADFNDDQRIDDTDRSLMVAALAAHASGNTNRRYDLDGDGAITTADSQIVDGYAAATGGAPCQ